MAMFEGHNHRNQSILAFLNSPAGSNNLPRLQTGEDLIFQTFNYLWLVHNTRLFYSMEPNEAQAGEKYFIRAKIFRLEGLASQINSNPWEDWQCDSEELRTKVSNLSDSSAAGKGHISVHNNISQSSLLWASIILCQVDKLCKPASCILWDSYFHLLWHCSGKQIQRI